MRSTLAIAGTYHQWKRDIEKHNFVLTPGRYGGIPEEEDDGVPFEEKMAALAEQMREAAKLDQEIKIQ
nr:hypothetical protein [Leptolyngbya sp. CCY15150]